MNVTPFDRSPSQQGGVAIGPVIAASALVDPGCTTEFSHGHHQDGIQQTASIQILDQSRKSLIRRWQQVILVESKIILVRVPILALLNAGPNSLPQGLIGWNRRLDVSQAKELEKTHAKQTETADLQCIAPAYLCCAAHTGFQLNRISRAEMKTQREIFSCPTRIPEDAPDIIS
jgi:hypothetical protein